jgi:hypothetical protein
LREITRKEVESIRSLAVVFLFEGEHLGPDWAQVCEGERERDGEEREGLRGERGIERRERD